jgi:hypothetical protein
MEFDWLLFGTIAVAVCFGLWVIGLVIYARGGKS